MTKEEILDKHHNLNLGMLSITEKQIQSAMDDYAKQEAISFHHWKGHDAFYYDVRKDKYLPKLQDGLNRIDYFTIEELYSLFLEQKK